MEGTPGSKRTIRRKRKKKKDVEQGTVRLWSGGSAVLEKSRVEKKGREWRNETTWRGGFFMGSEGGRVKVGGGNSNGGGGLPCRSRASRAEREQCADWNPEDTVNKKVCLRLRKRGITPSVLQGRWGSKKGDGT